MKPLKIQFIELAQTTGADRERNAQQIEENYNTLCRCMRPKQIHGAIDRLHMQYGIICSELVASGITDVHRLDHALDDTEVMDFHYQMYELIVQLQELPETETRASLESKLQFMHEQAYILHEHIRQINESMACVCGGYKSKFNQK